MKNTIFFIVSIALLFLCGGHVEAIEYITFSTGNVTGNYYPVGANLCKFVNMDRHDSSVMCSIESSAGSFSNLAKLKAGSADFAIIQSDILQYAFLSEKSFKEEEPFSSLRLVFMLYPEPLSIIVSRNSGIKTFSDLKDKKIYIGPQKSVEKMLMNIAFESLEWSIDNSNQSYYEKNFDPITAFCDAKIDGYVKVIGHPNDSLGSVLESCNGEILSIDNIKIRSTIKQNDFLFETKIARGTYANMNSDVVSFGVKAMFVTLDKVNDDVVYHVTKSIFEKFSSLKLSHPVLRSLSRRETIPNNQLIPIHSGAQKYFKEDGLKF